MLGIVPEERGAGGGDSARGKWGCQRPPSLAPTAAFQWMDWELQCYVPLPG